MIIEIPQELRGTERHIKLFIDAMIYKLAKNAHKGKWEDSTGSQAMEQLQQEVSELEEALTDEHNVVSIILECADVANFSLILANIAIRDVYSNGSD